MTHSNWKQSCATALTVIALSVALFACGGGSSSSSYGETNSQPERINFAGAGNLGIFDPSLARDPASNRLWMSYSSVETSNFYPPAQYWAVSIRLAFSDDNGASWQDAGVSLAARDDAPRPQPEVQLGVLRVSCRPCWRIWSLLLS